jgi:hypothetical protein
MSRERATRHSLSCPNPSPSLNPSRQPNRHPDPNLRPNPIPILSQVFYEGDERAFYQGLDGAHVCDPTEAIFDPACRTARRTHAEVAYNGNANSGAECTAGGACGYGVYRTAACHGPS